MTLYYGFPLPKHIATTSYSFNSSSSLSWQDCTQMVKSVQKARQRYQDQLARTLAVILAMILVMVDIGVGIF